MDAPAGWYPDPLGRHEHRYWDGSRWTDHAASGGATVVDPVAGHPPPGSTGAATAGGWSPSPTPAAGTEGLAVVSLVLSLVWLFGLGSIAGIVTGVMARRRIRASGGTRSGGGVAMAGILLGVLGLILTVLVVLLVAVLAVAPTSTFSTAGL